MTTPRLGAPELTEGQAAPETTVNEQLRYAEQPSNLWVIKDRDLATPPGSPADGDAYLIAGSPTGAWSGQAGKLTFRMNTEWKFVTVLEGMFAWIVDEAKLIRYTSSAWGDFTASASTASINAQSGTTYTLVLGDAQNVVQLTNGSPITMTIPPNASVAFPTGTVIEIHQGGAGTVTVSPGAGVTLLSRGSVFGLAGTDAVAAIRKVATNTWRLTGDIA